MSSVLPGLRAIPVTTFDHLETMRTIRNACRDGFAHDNREITPDQQRQWWIRNSQGIIAMVYLEDHGAPVGYGMLRQVESGAWVSSVAVLPEFGGKGYGRLITQHIIRQSPTGEVEAEARKDQPVAMALHRDDDWIVTGEDDRVMHYRTRPDILDRTPWEAAG